MFDCLKTLFELLEVYRGVPYFFKLHLVIRYILCPFSKLESFVPVEGTIVELGCGSGIFVNLLSMKSAKRHIIGYDYDEKKVAIAKRTMRSNERIEFYCHDIADLELTGLDIDAFVIVDVLYLIDFESQRRMFENCYKVLKEGGLLLIKTMSKKPAWKFMIDNLEETLSVKVFRITRGGKKFFHYDEDELVKELSEVGFSVRIERIDQFMPHPHIALICEK